MQPDYAIIMLEIMHRLRHPQLHTTFCAMLYLSLKECLLTMYNMPMLRKCQFWAILAQSCSNYAIRPEFGNPNCQKCLVSSILPYDRLIQIAVNNRITVSEKSEISLQALLFLLFLPKFGINHRISSYERDFRFFKLLNS